MSEPHPRAGGPGSLSRAPEAAFARVLSSGTRGLDIALEAGCVSLLVGATAVALIQVFFRYGLNSSLSWPEEVARWAFVWLVFVGMAIGIHRRSHIAIDLLSRRLPARWRRSHALFVQTVTAAACVMLVVHGIDLMGRSTYVSPAMEWPFVYLYMAVPTGGALGLLYLARQRIDGTRLPAIGVVVCALGVAVYLAFRYLGGSVLGTESAAPTLVAVGLILILTGVPIAFSLAFAAFAAFAPKGDLMLVTISQNMTSALDSFILLAIPFFILAAAIMNVGGITGRLIDLASRLVGHFRGGLGHVNVLTNTLMAGVSGSSMADAAAIAKVLVPEMEKRGYARPFGCALTSAAGVLANLIPPSLGLIVYGALASASVGALFVAAIVPGLLIALALALVVHLTSLHRGYGHDTPRSDGWQRLEALWRALPALILPLLIVGGVRFGVFTATEAGAIAVLYALVCGALLYRQLTTRNLISAVREALSDTIAVMVIIAAASPFAWILASEQVPQTIARHLGVFASSPHALLLTLNLFLLLTGLLMEMIASMVILVPIFIPMITAVGIDPIHFGVVIVINLVIGALTPPLGMLVFTTARVSRADVADVFRAVVPFLAALIVVLLLVTFVPGLSLTLPRLIGP